MIVIRLPFEAPPLRANDRYPHWAVKAKKVKLVRDATRLAAHGIAPIEGPVFVALIWEVTDKRRRDSDGPEPTKKACLDGLVDAGVLSDDKHPVVRRSWCDIEVGERKGVRIEIEAAA